MPVHVDQGVPCVDPHGVQNQFARRSNRPLVPGLELPLAGVVPPDEIDEIPFNTLSYEGEQNPYHYFKAKVWTPPHSAFVTFAVQDGFSIKDEELDLPARDDFWIRTWSPQRVRPAVVTAARAGCVSRGWQCQGALEDIKRVFDNLDTLQTRASIEIDMWKAEAHVYDSGARAAVMDTEYWAVRRQQ